MATHIHAIRGTPLLKFQSEERIQQFQAGKMYMKSLQWYRDYALNSPSIGDDYEAMLHINQATMLVTTLENDEPVAVQDITDGLIMTKHSNDYVFCMFGIKSNTERFSFSDEQKREMLSFGDTALLITDSEEFYKRVRDALIARGVSLQDAHCGFVHYYDETVDSVNILCSLLQGMHNVAFQKRNKYAYQQEYRFLLPNCDREEDFVELQIGDISDISEIYKSSVILNSLVTKEGNPNE